MNGSSLKITLRRVRLPEDDAFLRELYASRREDLKILSLEPLQIDALINMQYQAQNQAYRAEYPTAQHYIAELNGAAAGRYLIDRSGETEDAVIDIAIMPEHRGRGIGSRILSESIAEARRAGKVITLQVAPTNPALRLYLRLGGNVVGGDETSLILNWPSTEPAPGETDA
jgi:ribosomal protein S18 acetylase RimI-like enzyme